MSRTFWIKTTLLLTSSLTVMAGATIAPSLPDLSRVFSHEPHAELLSRLVLTLPALFIALAAPVAGYIIDRLGRKKLLLLSIVLYAAAGSSGLYLDSLYTILVGRALLGLAVAGAMTTSMTLIGDYFEGAERNHFMGIQGSFMALGGVIFISLGGWLADVGWRFPFGIYLSSLLFFIPAALFIYEPQHKRQSDIAFSVDSSLPRLPVSLIYGIGLLGMILFYIIPVQLPFLLTRELGVSNTKVGLAIALSSLAGAFISFNYHRIKNQARYPTIYILVFGLMGAGYLIISMATVYGMVIPGLILAGLGFGLMMPNTNLWLISISPTVLRGRVIGGLTTAVFLGQFLSPIAVKPIHDMTSLSGIFASAGGLMLCLSAGFALYAWRTTRISGWETMYDRIAAVFSTD